MTGKGEGLGSGSGRPETRGSRRGADYTEAGSSSLPSSPGIFEHRGERRVGKTYLTLFRPEDIIRFLSKTSQSQRGELFSGDTFSCGRGSEVLSQNPTKERTAEALRSRYGEPTTGTSPVTRAPRLLGPDIKSRKKRCSDCGRGTYLQWEVYSSPFLKVRICQSCAKRRGIWPR